MANKDLKTSFKYQHHGKHSPCKKKKGGGCSFGLMIKVQVKSINMSLVKRIIKIQRNPVFLEFLIRKNSKIALEGKQTN